MEGKFHSKNSFEKKKNKSYGRPSYLQNVIFVTKKELLGLLQSYNIFSLQLIFDTQVN